MSPHPSGEAEWTQEFSLFFGEKIIHAHLSHRLAFPGQTFKWLFPTCYSLVPLLAVKTFLQLWFLSLSKKKKRGASLVAQWLRICLLMQGTRVRALAWEDPTCRRAAGPVSHNC